MDVRTVDMATAAQIVLRSGGLRPGATDRAALPAAISQRDQPYGAMELT
jgi:hypothetical protein